MSLKIGIIGLPNVGKSTLFNALTKQKVDIANYPFCTIEPNVGVVAVPDDRLKKLAEFSRSKKIVPAVVEFVDIAGLVKGAADGEGLGNKFLTHIREVDTITEVIRVFPDKDIIRVSEKIEPISDIEIIEYELCCKDQETVDKRKETIEKEVRAGKKGAVEEKAILEKLISALAQGVHAHAALPADELTAVENLQLLTAKPLIYIFNASEKQVQEEWQPDAALQKKIENAPHAVVCAKTEADLTELAEEERKEYAKSIGIAETGLSQLIRIGYKTLNLITFFTTGEDETRAWTIPRGSTAPRAGRAIHSDFEEKFIKAEVINWEKLLEAGSWSHAKESGWIKTEGKEYYVKDGDVIEFKI